VQDRARKCQLKANDSGLLYKSATRQKPKADLTSRPRTILFIILSDPVSLGTGSLDRLDGPDSSYIQLGASYTYVGEPSPHWTPQPACHEAAGGTAWRLDRIH